MKKTLATLLSTAIVVSAAGCSTATKDITATYISPMKYADYDCEQITGDMRRVYTRMAEMSGKLDKNRENDVMIATAGTLLFFPALFFLGGTKEAEAEFARLKGEYNALEEVGIQKKCMSRKPAAPSNEARSVDPATAPASGLTGDSQPGAKINYRY